jgi:integrative and conjugative element protein (TIGR02256 family)
MACLVLPRGIVAEIKRVVFQTTNETGVRLVGEVEGRRYVVRHVIGPGGRAIQRPNYYQCDNEYAEDQFGKLLGREAHLRFLGELHVHPQGESELSRKDLATVRKVLRSLPFFIAGTILRRPFTILPVLFSRNTIMSLSCVLR